MTRTNYFDSSALVKHYFAEAGSDWVQTQYNDSSQIIALSDIGRVEIAAAFASKLRSKVITQIGYRQALGKLERDVQFRYQIVPVAPERVDEAIKLTTQNKLRGYDAVHLASALYLNQVLLTNNLEPVRFISADQALLQAAQSSGLATADPNQYP